MAKEMVHGKPSTYNNKGCRCRTEDNLFVPPQTMGCTEAWAEYMRPRIKAHREKQRQLKKQKQGVSINL